MYSKAEEICRSSDIYDVTSSTNGKIGARVENDESDNDVRKLLVLKPIVGKARERGIEGIATSS